MRASLSLAASPLLASLLFACAGDNFVPTGAASPGGGAGTGGGASGRAGASGNGASGQSGGGKGGAGGGVAGTGGTEAGAGGADAGAGGAEAGAGGADAGAGGADAGAGGADAGAAGSSGNGGASGATAGAGGDSGGSAGAAGKGGQGGSAGAGGISGAAGGGGTAGAAGSAGSAGSAGAAGGGGIAGAGGGGSPSCPVLYVASGNAPPNATGCVSNAPLAHLSDALAALTQLAEPAEIRICAGNYAEGALLVPRAVNISGSWDCTDANAWVLPDLELAKIGTNITSAEPTGITFGGAGHTPDTSSLRGVRLTMKPGSAASEATGILLDTATSPTIQFVHVLFEGLQPTVGASYGSAALVTRQGSAAKILQNRFRAGPGAATDALGLGSVGVSVFMPATGFEFKGNDVQGGRGTPAFVTQHGSVGMAISAGDANIAIEDNEVIEAGVGSTELVTAFFPSASTGLLLRRAAQATTPNVSIAVRRTSVSGGQTGQCSLGCETRGIYVQRAGGDKAITLELERARVYGGDYNAAKAGESLGHYTTALRAERSTVIVTSSILHGGGLEGNTHYTRGVSLLGSTFNAHFLTLLPGTPKAGATTDASSANAVGFFLQAAQDSKPSIELYDALVVASFPQTYGIFAETPVCDSGYTLTGARDRYVHHEAAAGSPPSDQVGFFGAQSSKCPLGLLFAGTNPNGEAQTTVDVADAVHVFGTPSGTVTPSTIEDCSSSQSCLKKLFADLDTSKIRPAILESGSAGFAPTCGVGAGIDRGAAVDGTPDLLGTQRNNSVRAMKGALVRPSGSCKAATP